MQNFNGNKRRNQMKDVIRYRFFMGLVEKILFGKLFLKAINVMQI